MTGSGFERVEPAALRCGFCLEKGQNRTAYPPAARIWQHKHALEFAILRAQDDGTTSHGLTLLVARNREDHVLSGQCIKVDAVMAFRRIQRFLVGVELLDKANDFRLLRVLATDSPASGVMRFSGTLHAAGERPGGVACLAWYQRAARENA